MSAHSLTEHPQQMLMVAKKNSQVTLNFFHARIQIFFLVDEGREDPNTIISGPSSYADDVPTLNAGLKGL